MIFPSGVLRQALRHIKACRALPATGHAMITIALARQIKITERADV
jgi:hypothetical protein